MGYDTLLDPGTLEDLKSKFPDAWTIFNALDVEKSGTLSLSKDTLWDKLAPLGDEAATQILGMIDLNGDGVIDFNEFVFAWKDNPPFKSQMEKDSSRPEDDEDVP